MSERDVPTVRRDLSASGREDMSAVEVDLEPAAESELAVAVRVAGREDGQERIRVDLFRLAAGGDDPVLDPRRRNTARQ